jgi:CHAT domain-containing protein/Tfp pilus assembly protein PilF
MVLGLALGGCATPSQRPDGGDESAKVSQGVDARALREQSAVLWQAGKREQALARLDEAVTRFPDDDNNYYQRGVRLAALKRLAEAIADLRRATELNPTDAGNWGNLGWYQLLNGEWAASRKATEKALDLDPASYAWRVNLGHSYWLAGEDKAARVHYQATLPLIPDDKALSSGPLADFDLFIQKGWRVSEAEREKAWFIEQFPVYAPYRAAGARLEAAKAKRRAGAYEAAIKLADEGVSAYQTLLPADHPLVTTAQATLADIHQSHDVLVLGQAADMLKLARLHQGDSEDLLAAGHPQQSDAQYKEAINIAKMSLSLYKKLLPADDSRLSAAQATLADIHYFHGQALQEARQYAEAIDAFEQALAYDREHRPKDAGFGLRYIGDCYRDLRRFDEAITAYEAALVLTKSAVGEESGSYATSLNNLAGLYDTLGQYDQALPLYQRALAIREKVLGPDHVHTATSLNNLARLYHTLGQYDQALPLLQRALAIDEKTSGPNHPEMATTLNNLAGVYRALGQYPEAKSRYERTLAIWEKTYGPNHPRVATALNNLAGIYDTLGQYDHALPLYQQAFAIALIAGEAELLWVVQGNLSQFAAEQSHPGLAIFYGKQAVNTLQSVRQANRGLEEGLQQGFVKSKESYYKGLADLLIGEGRIPEAQQVLAMLKEQEYFDFVRRDGAADVRQTKAAYNAFESEQLAAYEQGSRELARLGAEYQQLMAIKSSARTPEQEVRLKALKKEISVANITFKAALEHITRAFEQLSTERREALATRQLQSDDRGLVRELGDEVALLHTLVMDDKVHLLLTLPRVMLARSSAVGQAQLNQQVQQLRAALGDPRRDPRPAARALYDSLIAPIEADLQQAGVETLMVSLDGSLRYIPMAALYDGEHYLVERYALSVFTDAARDKVAQRPRVDWTLSGFGVSKAHEAFSALPSVVSELAGIVREGVSDSDGALQGRAHLDETFTEESLMEGLERPVVHIASHFSLQPGNESQSFLLLGDGSHLKLSQLREGDYDFGSVDLLTLSACQTAVGGQNAAGQEVEGLGTLAQKQGAKSVIATLWPVADASTGQFMQRFYRLREGRNLSKAEALRQAQLGFIQGETSSDSNEESKRGGRSVGANGLEQAAYPLDPEHPYAHPYYWAPFILMGNWL